jgi:glycosyltransferase involved in cell wall biosynthesis
MKEEGNMKLLTIAVPSFNSQDYLAGCIDSLLIGGDKVEIIIIDDGSTDNTGAIADSYQEKHPDIVRVIHQENGGHGEGVNQGLAHATGLYYKVVDSDDFLAKEGYLALLKTIENQMASTTLPDLIICNFTYEHIYDSGQYVSEYRRYMKPNQIISWDKVKRFPLHHMLLMHALVYKTDTLRSSHLVLPKHCFYVDDIYAYQPLFSCKTLLYLPVNLYRYRIGRPDQSVTTANMFKRYKQQVKVMTIVYQSFHYDQIQKMPRGLKHYLLHSLATLNLTTLFFITGGDDSDVRKKELKTYLSDMKAFDRKTYRYLMDRSYYLFVSRLNYRCQKFSIVHGYNLVRKICKLG